MLKKMIIIAENEENGKEMSIALDVDQAVYILRYIKDLNHLFYYLDQVVKKWKVKE